jgi:hypothetical protein
MDLPYDASPDDFESSLKTVDVQAIFAAQRPQQVAVAKALSEKPRPKGAHV